MRASKLTKADEQICVDYRVHNSKNDTGPRDMPMIDVESLIR